MYTLVCTGLHVQVSMYRLRVYRFAGTDLYVQTRVYRIVGTDLHVQAYVHRHARAHGGSAFRARPHFNGYNSKMLIPTIGPREYRLKICWYCVFTAIAHESAMADLCTYSRAFRGYTNQKLEK